MGDCNNNELGDGIRKDFRLGGESSMRNRRGVSAIPVWV